MLPFQRDYRLRLRTRNTRGMTKTLEQAYETRFELSAQYRLRAQPAQVTRVHRSIKPIKAQMGSGVQFAHRWHHLRRKPRGRVHGHIEAHKVRVPQKLLVQSFAREVHTRDACSGLDQPGRR